MGRAQRRAGAGRWGSDGAPSTDAWAGGSAGQTSASPPRGGRMRGRERNGHRQRGPSVGGCGRGRLTSREGHGRGRGRGRLTTSEGRGRGRGRGRGLSPRPQCPHPTGAPVPVPAAPLPTRLPASTREGSRRQARGPCTQEAPRRSSGSWPCLAPPGPLPPSGGGTAGRALPLPLPSPKGQHHQRKALGLGQHRPRGQVAPGSPREPSGSVH